MNLNTSIGQQDKIFKIVVVSVVVVLLVVIGVMMVLLFLNPSPVAIQTPFAKTKPVKTEGNQVGTPSATGVPGEAVSPGTESAGKVLAPNLSPISEEGNVVTPQGEPVKLDVIPGSPQAPQQSSPLAKQDIPQNAKTLTLTSEGFAPSEFAVRAGEAVILSVTSGDDWTHVFKFESPSLSAVAVGLGPRETRSIAFNAPAVGEYKFFCDVPGHAGRGEAGKMVVK